MFIRTERLFLRPAWREDAPTLARLLGQPGVQHELTGSPWLEALGDADHFLASGGSRDVRLLVFRRTEGGPKLIGTAGVGQPLDRSEFGLWLSRAERRRGFAQEAGCALLRSEEHTSELQSLMRISYAVFCLKKKTKIYTNTIDGTI